MFLVQKAKFSVFFMIVIFTSPCFSQDITKINHSEEVVRENLYELFDLDMDKIQNRKLFKNSTSTELTNLDEPLRRMMMTFLKIEETNLLKKFKGIEGRKIIRHDNESKWKNVLDPYNTFFLIEFFEIDLKLTEWLNVSSEPFYNAIKSGNLSAIRLFGERGRWNWEIGSMKLSPLHFSMILNDGFNMEIVDFFLNHPKTNLEAKTIFGENLFHVIFLAPPRRRIHLIDLLFQREYFQKISHLLNKPNNFGETPFDVAIKARSKENSKIVAFMKKEGALSSQDMKTLIFEKIQNSYEIKEYKKSIQVKEGEVIFLFQCRNIFKK